MTTFADLKLPPALLQALSARNYDRPTPIQAATLAELLSGSDVLAQAQTGSGKTAAFGLALLARLKPGNTRLQSLVLCPTRELADQVAKEIRTLASCTPNIKVLSLYGGVALHPQLASLSHEPQVVVGTPGRILDLIGHQALSFDALDSVTLDEADRMLDMGFVEPIQQILGHTPRDRRTWLFSATYPASIRQISDALQRNPKIIRLADKSPGAAITQRFFRAEPEAKLDLLTQLLLHDQPASCLVFCHTRDDAGQVATGLAKRGFSALELHGGLDQRDRDETVVQFANGSCQVLVATDVAARGLDIKELPLVVSWELPKDPNVHTHRIGRTGRAGSKGFAYSLVARREEGRFEALRNALAEGAEWSKPEVPLSASQPATPKMKTLVIDAGRRDKLRPGDILGALTGDGGLHGNEVGKIDLFATRAYVAVAFPRFRATLQRLRAIKIKNRKFRVRPA